MPHRNDYYRAKGKSSQLSGPLSMLHSAIIPTSSKNALVRSHHRIISPLSINPNARISFTYKKAPFVPLSRKNSHFQFHYTRFPFEQAKSLYLFSQTPTFINTQKCPETPASVPPPSTRQATSATTSKARTPAFPTASTRVSRTRTLLRTPVSLVYPPLTPRPCVSAWPHDINCNLS